MSQNQAVWLDAPGKRLRVGPAEMPKVAPGKVLVRTRALAINAIDCMKAWCLHEASLIPS